MSRLGPVLVASALLVGGCAAGGAGGAGEVVRGSEPSSSAAAPRSDVPSEGGELPEPTREPLAGRTIVLDPGHQLGNRNFPEETSRPVPAGGFTKPCNTTGTATNDGYPEATFNWRVAQVVRRRLEQRGADVVLTRTTNSARRWGPCVDERGRAGNRLGADLKLSIHGDGSYAAGAHGFHVITPADRRPWTHDIARPSRRLALAVRTTLHRGAGLDYATYTAGGDGLAVRSDLATLNLSDVPTVLVELGNLRDADDAARMTSARGQRACARALVQAATRFVTSGG